MWSGRSVGCWVECGSSRSSGCVARVRFECAPFLCHSVTSFASAAGVGSAVMGAVAGGCGGLIEGVGGGEWCG